MFVLDTDTLTLAFHDHPAVTARMKAAEQPGSISIVTRLEVLGGRSEAILKAENAERLLRAQAGYLASAEFVDLFPVLWFDDRAAALSDQFRTAKGAKKVKVKLKDLLIACICLAHDATLVTRNTKDFQGVPNLKLENWAD